MITEVQKSDSYTTEYIVYDSRTLYIPTISVVDYIFRGYTVFDASSKLPPALQ